MNIIFVAIALIMVLFSIEIVFHYVQQYSPLKLEEVVALWALVICSVGLLLISICNLCL